MVTNKTCLLLVLTCCANLISAKEPTLSSLCANEDVELTSISQVRKFVEEAEQCPSFKESLIQMDDMLARMQSGNKCSLEMVDKIRDYQSAFIVSSSQNKIPKALKRFFIAMGFQINAECKMMLINSLEVDTKERISEEDYDEILLLEKAGATLIDESTEMSDFDDIVLVNDLQSVINKGESLNSEDETKLLIKVKSNKILHNLIKTCQRKFKPIYDKLIMPLIKLSNLGYNYRGELLAQELKELKRNELIRHWYNIVQTCEAFDSIEIFESDDGEIGDQQALTFITRTEADKLRKIQQVADELEDDDTKAIEYEPSMMHNSDILWITSQEELDMLIKKYKTDASESQRIRKRLLKKLFNHVKENLKAGNVMTFVHMVKDKLTDKPSSTNVNEDLIMMIDDAVESKDEQAGADKPVSGLLRRSAPASVIPARSGFVGGFSHIKDQTKWSTKLYNSTIGKALPDKSTLICWILAIAAVLLIGLHFLG